MTELFHKANNLCLYLLVFSVTFENWDPFHTSGVISITYMVTILYILSWFPFLTTLKSLIYLRQFVVPLLLFILVGIISTTINSYYARSLEDIIHKRMVQLIILMFLIAAHLMLRPKLIKQVLFTYVVSVLVMYLLYLAGQGVTFEHGRVLIFGENPNLIGLKATIAFHIGLNIVLNKNEHLFIRGFSALCLFPFFMMIVLSASRGALVSLFLGVLILVVNLKIELWKRFFLTSLGVFFALGSLTYIMETNPVFRERILKAVESGDIGRNTLWEAAMKGIEENLFFGVGIPGDMFTMFKYGGRFMDPHNVFLWVLLTTGFIGFIFFMAFIIRLAYQLFRNYQNNDFAVYTIIFLMALMNMAKAGGGIGKIIFWFLFGILIAGTNYMNQLRTNHIVE